MSRGSFGRAVVFGAVFFGALAFTLPRVARDVVLFGDSAELVAAASVWGVAHPPGYPLYTALVHLATWLPFADPALPAHLTSVVFHAACVALLGLVVLELTSSLPAAFGAAILLTLSRSFLLGSLYAEVFPLNDALAALLLWLALRARAAGPERARWLISLFAAFGVAAGHHQTIALWLPGLVVLSWQPLRQAWSARFLVRALVAAAVPAFLSLAMLWLAARRDAAVSYGDVHDFGSLFALVTREDYGGLFSASRHPNQAPATERIGAWATLLFESVGPLGLGLAALGSVTLIRPDPRTAVALFLSLVLAGPAFAAANRVSVAGEAELAFFERFTTLSHVPVAALAGAGIARVTEWLPNARVGALVALLPGVLLLKSAWRTDLRADGWGRAFATDLLADVPRDALVLISGNLQTSAAQYACATSPACEGRFIVAPGQLFVPWKLRQAKRRYPELEWPEGRLSWARSHELVEPELGRRPVFVTPALLTKDPELTRGRALEPHGLLVRLVSELDRDRALGRMRAIADGRACEGCRLDPESALLPSQHVQVLRVYAAVTAGLSRHAVELGDRELGARLGERSRRLFP